MRYNFNLSYNSRAETWAFYAWLLTGLIYLRLYIIYIIYSGIHIILSTYF